MALRVFKTLDREGITALWEDIVFTIAEGLQTVKNWADARFARTVNRKGIDSNGNIQLTKADIDLGLVDNTPDIDKSVAYARDAGDADTVDGMHAKDFATKQEHDDFERLTAEALDDLNSRINNSEGNIQSDWDALSTSKASILNKPVINTTIVTGKGNKDLPTVQAVIDYVTNSISGAGSYLGTINNLSSLILTARKGDYYRVSDEFSWTSGGRGDTAHVGDLVIAEKENPERKLDGTNWTVIHLDNDTNTTYEIYSDGEIPNTFFVHPSDEEKPYPVEITVDNVNGFTVQADVPAGAEFTDTWKPNTAAQEGYVAKPNTDKSGGKVIDGNKVWKTDENGNPAWREDENKWELNIATKPGYVAAPGLYNSGKVWKTDELGNPEWREEGVANALNVAGYVAAPTSTTSNQVWKTDKDGNPAWREDGTTQNGHYTPTGSTVYQITLPTSDDDEQIVSTLAVGNYIKRDSKYHVTEFSGGVIRSFTAQEVHDIVAAATIRLNNEMEHNHE